MTTVAAGLAVMFVGATLPTPLYPQYRQSFGFSGITLTLVYAVYVLGNLIALLVFGRLSDQIGRRRTSLPAIGVAFISTVVFVLASGTIWLFAARILSGFATGLAAGAATAWIAELQPRGDKAAAALVASSANLIGLAAGSLMAGLLAQFAPWPLHLVYAAYLVMLIAIALPIMTAPETVRDPVRRWGEVSLRPRLGVPKEIRARFVAPAVAAFANFALLGFYAALIPNLLTESLDEPGPAVAGIVVLELFAVAAGTDIATRRLGTRASMLSGLALLPPALALVVIAQMSRSLSILLAATALAGIAAGLVYRGSLEAVNRIAPAEKRSEVVSTYMVACYLGNSLPVIGIGLISARAGSLAAHIVFAVVIAIFAVVALATGAKYAPRE
jgi:MFS family permease